MGTNTALTVLVYLIVIVVLGTALWAFVIAPFWVPWHHHHER